MLSRLRPRHAILLGGGLLAAVVVAILVWRPGGQGDAGVPGVERVSASADAGRTAPAEQMAG